MRALSSRAGCGVATEVSAGVNEVALALSATGNADAGKHYQYTHAMLQQCAGIEMTPPCQRNVPLNCKYIALDSANANNAYTPECAIAEIPHHQVRTVVGCAGAFLLLLLLLLLLDGRAGSVGACRGRYGSVGACGRR